MASSYAEMHVDGHVFPIRLCTYGVHQATHQRGRVSTKVRYDEVNVTLDVPHEHVLSAWAAAPQKRLPASLVFKDAAGGSALETVSLKAAYCVSYDEEFVHGDVNTGAYVCLITLSDPDGWTMLPGGPATTFVAPAAREHGLPVALLNAAIGGGPAPDPHAADWAAARAKALDPARIAGLYAVYKARKEKKKETPRPQDKWWGEPGKRGGAGRTVDGCLGEYQADKLFAAQGHQKLNHGGQLVGLLDPPRGTGIDGVWRNATPPPEYIITETKYGKPPKLTKATKQMTNEWIFGSDRLTRAVDDEEEADRITTAQATGQVEKRVLHIDFDGKLTEYKIEKTSRLTKI
ncbi:type VI secretion system tube protein TssD [Hymenobacter terrenus]|uniref:type VI secretion system tube protein TssD n=1 Tax=Hymenobacter terrenus TaxID=1629124 RepID=UPI0006990494|nr:type VI secretion system tube protein TssD [Hymenobacter terrenus]